MLLYADYMRLVRKVYQLKKEQNLLPPSISNPGRKALREESVRICRSRLRKEDLKIIREFFDWEGNEKEIIDAVERLPVDRFRPLVNLMMGETINSEKKNVELLAWLIDFQPRPFEGSPDFYPKLAAVEAGLKRGELYLPDQAEPESSQEEEKQAAAGEPEKLPTEQWGLLSGGKKELVQRKRQGKLLASSWLIGLGLAAAGGIVAYFSLPTGADRSQPDYFFQHQACMYWTGTAYKKAPCLVKKGDTLLVALDSTLLLNFQRITTPDTISEKAIGQVHYSKRNKVIDYFTCGGKHPEDPTRKLRPLTKYIYDKYLRPLPPTSR